MFRHTRQEPLEPSTAERRERERERERERAKRTEWLVHLSQAVREGFDDVQVEGSAPCTSYEFSRPPTQKFEGRSAIQADVCDIWFIV